MKSYVVYAPNGAAPRTEAGADGLIFVREGFSWGAFLLTLPWLLWRRAWLGLAVYIAGLLVIAMLRWFGLPQFPGFLISVLLSLAVALEAPWLRSLTLHRRGYRPVAVASGPAQADAERAFFADWLAGEETPIAQASALAGPAMPLPRLSPSPVLGVFPQPDVRR